LRLPYRNTLSDNAGLQESWVRRWTDSGWGNGTSTFSNRLDLQTRFRYNLTTDLAHNLAWQISHFEDLPFAGVTTNQLEGRLESETLRGLRMLASTNFDLRPYRVDNSLRRLDLLKVQANYTPEAPFNLGITGSWHAVTARFKGIDSSLNLFDSSNRWNLGLTSSWVNNAITPVMNPVDSNAPTYLDFSPVRMPDLYLLSTTTSFEVTPAWRLYLYQRLNLVSKQVEEQSFGIWRDLHCWEIRLSVKQRLDGTFEYGFSINLKAFPQFKAAMPGADLYTGGFGAR
jgi:hypothetical protein